MSKHQIFYREEADSQFPEGCRCVDRGGDCNWCLVYYWGYGVEGGEK